MEFARRGVGDFISGAAWYLRYTLSNNCDITGRRRHGLLCLP